MNSLGTANFYLQCNAGHTSHFSEMFQPLGLIKLQIYFVEVNLSFFYSLHTTLYIFLTLIVNFAKVSSKE